MVCWYGVKVVGVMGALYIKNTLIREGREIRVSRSEGKMNLKVGCVY